jgi:hypothetical protein
VQQVSKAAKKTSMASSPGRRVAAYGRDDDFMTPPPAKYLLLYDRIHACIVRPASLQRGTAELIASQALFDQLLACVEANGCFVCCVIQAAA